MSAFVFSKISKEVSKMVLNGPFGLRTSERGECCLLSYFMEEFTSHRNELFLNV